MAVGPATLARPAPVEGRPVTLRGLLEREGVFSWLMLAPGVAFLLAFVAYPFFYGIFLSLQDRRVASTGGFVCPAHFTTPAPEPRFWQGARHKLVYKTFATGLKIAGGLALALPIKQRVPGPQ